MKRKLVLSILASASILFVSVGVNNAEAASPYSTAQKRVYVYQSSNHDISKYNQYLQKYYQDCQIKWDKKNNWTVTEKPIEKQAKPPVPQEPAQKPAETPVQQPAPKLAEPVTETPVTSQVSAFEQQVIDLTNQERAKNGLPALKLDEQLSKAARAKSADMQTNNYFSHTSPTYGSPFDMMKQFGISYRGAGENIAMGQRTPQEVVNAWMNSSGHRANILNRNFTHIGVGHVANGNYWTQMFITK